jgi:peptidoglycan/LPS O-acetylase OafA/YrhL
VTQGFARGERLSRASSIALDLIRVAAAEVVVVGHAVSFLGYQQRGPWFQDLGVVVFFVLSGVVITHSTLGKLRRPDYRFRDFFIDRFARIYAGLVPALLFIALADLVQHVLRVYTYGPEYTFDVRTFVANVFLLENHPGSVIANGVLRRLGTHFTVPQFPAFGSGRPLWTLAVEWWIYLWFGWLVVGHRGRGRRSVGYLGWLGVLSIAPFFYAVAGRGNGLAIMWLLGPLILLACGSAELSRVDRAGATFIAPVFLLMALVRMVLIHDANDLLVASGIAGSMLFVLISLQRGEAPAWLERSAAKIRSLAAFSFTLYLTHYSVILLLLPLRQRMPRFMLLVVMALCANLVAYGLARLFETRHAALNRWIRRRLGEPPERHEQAAA